MPIVIAVEQLDMPCTEMWIDPLGDLATAVPDASPEQLEAAAVEATWVLWSLTGERFHGDQCWVDDYKLRRGFGCRIELTHWPLGTVASVSRVDLCSDEVGVTGIGDELSSWCALPSGIVKICCSDNTFGSSTYFCQCSGTNVIRVRYNVRNNLPPGADRAVFNLATQYLKALLGDPGCKLPDRITTITRQGASWTVLDPQEFLTQGRTGLAQVDHWLSAANQRGFVRVYDPLIRPELLASRNVGCGDDCYVDILGGDP